MGPSGYPLLLATGEDRGRQDAPGSTASTRTNLFMELSAALSHAFRRAMTSAFVYGRLGPASRPSAPPTFMHRLSGMDQCGPPRSPTIGWISTHITYGGWVGGHRRLGAP